MLEQAGLIGGETEEIALLLDPLDRRAALDGDPAPVALLDFVRAVIGFVAHGIPAGVFVEIDVAGIDHPLPQRLDRPAMARLGRANEIVHRAIEQLDHALELGSHAGHQLARRHPIPDGGLLHLEAMLVGAGEEEHVIAVEPLEPGERIRCQRLIGVTDMGITIR